MKHAIMAGVAAVCLTLGPAFAEEPVQVMILGTVHMSNPDRDVLNIAFDDVLAAKRQAELATADEGLARFAPTAVAVEWPADVVDERYPQYLAGTLKPSKNEVVQLGFRLARTMKLGRVYGIDTDGDFPLDPVTVYAKAHGQSAILDAAWNALKVQVAAEQKAVDTESVSHLLRLLNQPDRIAEENKAFYGALLRVGGGNDQPGADLLAAWQKRNNSICAKLVQLAKPGDRIVVMFGAGHAFRLRQCVAELPGYTLVEPNDYLPE